MWAELRGAFFAFLAAQFMPLLDPKLERPILITIRPVIDLKVQHRCTKIFDLE
jgi:hypothetical protein